MKTAVTLLPSPAACGGGLGTPISAPLTRNPKEPLHLGVFMDASILEVFADGRCCLTARIYPSSQNTQVRVFARNSPVRRLGFEGWTMNSIW